MLIQLLDIYSLYLHGDQLQGEFVLGIMLQVMCVPMLVFIVEPLYMSVFWENGSDWNAESGCLAI